MNQEATQSDTDSASDRETAIMHIWFHQEGRPSATRRIVRALLAECDHYRKALEQIARPLNDPPDGLEGLWRQRLARETLDDSHPTNPQQG